MKLLTPLITSVLMAGPCAAQDATRDVMVVFDMSGSMWGQVDGVAKVEIARDSFGELITDWSNNNTNTGLIAYGHRRRGDCLDIELLARPGDGADISALVAPLQPRGKTPLSDAVRQAADVLRYTEEAATVVLLSDGVETCEADPCAVGAELEALGLDFTAHVIGFDIAEGDKAQLQCLASATGGQYFDAADASGLSDAMEGVAQATAIAAPPELVTQDFQIVSIRVRIGTRTLALPEEITIFGNDFVLGTLTDETAVIPGLPIEMPFGPITLRVEGEGISGEMVVDITDQTEIIELEVTGAQADYVIWREGQLPVIEGGTEHIVLLKNTTGIDRASFYRSFLYQLGSTDPAQSIRAGNVPPTAGVYAAVRVPSPATPGDYELVPTGTDGTEYARIPISFAATIDPVWQGPTEVAPGEVFDASWAGSSNRRDVFQFMQGGQRISRVTVQSMATEDGFQLQAPEEPGLYDLVFVSDFENSIGEKTTALGQIAVGVPLPQGDAPDFDTSGMQEEADAMGGEEFPLLPIGDLHGDWQLIFQNSQRTLSLIEFQLSHAEGETSSTGGFGVYADPSWGFGPKGGSGDVTLTKADKGAMTMTITINGSTKNYEMTPSAVGWATDIIDTYGATVPVLLIKADDFAAAEEVKNNTPVTIQIVALDEHGERPSEPVTWVLQTPDADTPETLKTQAAVLRDEGRIPGSYSVTATSGDLVGRHNMNFGLGYPGEIVVLKPASEGTDLALSVDYYCSEGEDCAMVMTTTPIYFTLPVGWGAERPIRTDQGLAMFNMTTNTPTGPFFATLNQPQRSADLGPCFELVSGAFCHDATNDPALLADVEALKNSLSFRPVGGSLNQERFDDLLNKLTGAAQ